MILYLSGRSRKYDQDIIVLSGHYTLPCLYFWRQKTKTIMSAIRPNLCPHITEEVANELKSVGVKTVSDFIRMDLEHLAQETTISFKVCSF